MSMLHDTYMYMCKSGVEIGSSEWMMLEEHNTCDMLADCRHRMPHVRSLIARLTPAAVADPFTDQNGKCITDAHVLKYVP